MHCCAGQFLDLVRRLETHGATVHFDMHDMMKCEQDTQLHSCIWKGGANYNQHCCKFNGKVIAYNGTLMLVQEVQLPEPPTSLPVMCILSTLLCAHCQWGPEMALLRCLYLLILLYSLLLVAKKLLTPLWQVPAGHLETFVTSKSGPRRSRQHVRTGASARAAGLFCAATKSVPAMQASA